MLRDGKVIVTYLISFSSINISKANKAFDYYLTHQSNMNTVIEMCCSTPINPIGDQSTAYILQSILPLHYFAAAVDWTQSSRSNRVVSIVLLAANVLRQPVEVRRVHLSAASCRLAVQVSRPRNSSEWEYVRAREVALRESLAHGWPLWILREKGLQPQTRDSKPVIRRSCRINKWPAWLLSVCGEYGYLDEQMSSWVNARNFR